MTETVYRMLYRIRRVQEEIARIYPSDKIVSPIHLSLGQEAVSVAVCQALRPDDVVFGSCRCHALYLAKGGDLDAMMAELYGKATGCAKGKAGSMHLIDVNAGVMGASAIVSSSIPLATGYALAAKMQGKDLVVASFFGDGAVEEGVFHESLNFARLERLPILFVCENNFYAVHARLEARQANRGIAELARAHGLPAESLDSRDLDTLLARAGAAVEAIRQGPSGPRFLEVTCYRWSEHVGPGTDFDAGYRSRAEAEPWLAADPVRLAGRRLPDETRLRIEREEEDRLARAIEFAEQSPFPDDSELTADLFAAD